MQLHTQDTDIISCWNHENLIKWQAPSFDNFRSSFFVEKKMFSNLVHELVDIYNRLNYWRSRSTSRKNHASS